MKLILTTFIVCYGVLPVWPNPLVEDAITGRVNDGSKVQENFRHFFDSLTKNDMKKTGAYRNLLEQTAVKEEQAFHMMKDQLQSVRQKNALHQRNVYSKNGDIDRHVGPFKRETSEKPKSASYVSNIPSATSFVAATPLNGFENFYSKPRLVYSEDLTFTVKADICMHIIKSPLLRRTFQLDPLSLITNKGLYELLRDNYPGIHDDLFGERNSSVVGTNRHLERELVVGERVVKDFIFSCPAMDHMSGNVTRYYVSGISLFNLDNYRDHKDQMKGVFIFMERGEKIELVAMAEQPGYVVDPAHSLYSFELEVKPENTYEKHEVEDTICGLMMHEKIRLCTIVLSTPNFRKEATFLPTEANVDDRCFRGVIRIHKNKANITETDWMIGCIAENRETYKTVTYYISAGFESPDQIMFCTKNERGDKIMVGGVGCRIDVRKKVRYPE